MLNFRKNFAKSKSHARVPIKPRPLSQSFWDFIIFTVRLMPAWCPLDVATTSDKQMNISERLAGESSRSSSTRMRTLKTISLTRKIATISISGLWHRPFKPSCYYTFRLSSSQLMAQTIELAQVRHCPSLQSLQHRPSYFCRRQREIIWKHWKKNIKIVGNQKSYSK